MVFQFFFEATFGIATGLGAAVLLVMWVHKRFINGIGRGGNRC